MKRTAVDSSNLASIGYRKSDQTLEIRFKSGAIYNYTGVPENVYNELMAADSHGKYFNENIRKADYPYSKVN